MSNCRDCGYCTRDGICNNERVCGKLRRRPDITELVCRDCANFKSIEEYIKKINKKAKDREVTFLTRVLVRNYYDNGETIAQIAEILRRTQERLQRF